MSKKKAPSRIEYFLLKVPTHPFLASAWFLLAFHNYNKLELTTTSLIMPLSISLVITWLGFTTLNYWLKDKFKAGLLALFGVLAFFSFGYVQSFLAQQIEFASPLWRDAPFMVLTLLAGGGLGWFLKYYSKDLYKITGLFNFLFSLLVVFNLWSLIKYHVTNPSAFEPPNPTSVNLSSSSIKPNIYYFVLDTYPSSKTLKQIYNYDNSTFTNYLKANGFKINDTYTNYQFTSHSLASAFNLRYLDEVAVQLKDKTISIEPLHQLISRPRMVSLLKQLGYKYIHVSSRWGPTRLNPLADRNFDEAISYVLLNRKFTPSEFASIILRKSLLNPLFELGVKIGELRIADTSYKTPEYNSADFGQLHAKTFKYQVEVLSSQLPASADPKFIFAHILMPHVPFVFNPNGSLADYDKSTSHSTQLLNQLKYTNIQMQEVIQAILKNDNQAVIIIQADEGPYPEGTERNKKFNWLNLNDRQLQEKFGILAAYRFPGKDADKFIPDGMTSVNAIRALLNAYFGANLELLDNRHFLYGTELDIYNLHDITDRIENLRLNTDN